MSASKFALCMSAAAFAIFSSASAAPVQTFDQDTPFARVQDACAGLQIIILDERYICETISAETLAAESLEQDSLSKIIADMQTDNAERNPLAAAQVGNAKAMGRLPRVTPDAINGAARFHRALLERLSALSIDTLPAQDRLNAQLLDYVLRQNLFSADYDQARLPFTNDSGFFNMLSHISVQTRFENSADYEAYAARLSDLPRYFREQQNNMQRGVDTGFTASTDILPGIIDMIEKLANTSPAQHSLFAPFTQFPDQISKTEQARLSALGTNAMNRHVLPAYQNLHRFMQTEYAPHARIQAGIGTNTANRKYYQALVKHYTTLDLSPDQVHELGLLEVKRIRGEMDTVIAQTDFKGSFKEFLTFLRTDEQFYAQSADELLSFASLTAKRIDGQMPRFFGKLARLPYGVKAVPDDIAPNYTTGRYWGGNLKTGIAGNFMVNTHDLKQRPLYNIPALALHEGVPGHHHQISLAQELENVPAFRQELYPNAFGEGWGLYAEKLGVEMGIYQTPYEHFGRLTYEMWRACRLVVDTGMHWKGWNREQAEACFLENSALSTHNIRTEVDRYISWPGQALSYKIGELKILELRANAQAALGEDFKLSDFHDQVLANGGIPLNILEAQITAWIAKQTQNTTQAEPG